jgi:probable rRNA maturation factor
MSLLRRHPATPPTSPAATPRQGTAVDVVVSTGGRSGSAAAPDGTDGERWAELARRVLQAERVVGPAELSLAFVDEAEMADLNRRWMGQEGSTDVLSWPADDPEEARRADRPSGGPPLLLGDVVVCAAVAQRQAAADGRPLDDELALLVVHGVLHVLGHDHDVPAREAAMQQREAELLIAFHDPRWSRPR